MLFPRLKPWGDFVWLPPTDKSVGWRNLCKNFEGNRQIHALFQIDISYLFLSPLAIKFGDDLALVVADFVEQVEDGFVHHILPATKVKFYIGT